MSEAKTDEAPKRVLLIYGEEADLDSLRSKLTLAGFAADSADVESAPACVADSMPAAVLLSFGEREGEGWLIALAGGLRTQASRFALLVLLLFRADNRALRSPPQHLGADDSFAQDATPEE